MPLCSLSANNINNEALPQWPLVWGVPLAPAQLTDPQSLSVTDENGNVHAAQGSALVRHADGSVRRLLLCAEAPLQAHHEHLFELQAQVADTPEPPATACEDALHGAAGVLQLARDHLTLERHGRRYAWRVSAAGCPAGADPEELSCRWIRLEPFASGPVMAAGVFYGELSHRDEALAHLRMTVRVFQKTPVLLAALQLKNLSPRQEIALDHVHLQIAAPGQEWARITYEFRHFGGPNEAELPLTARSQNLQVQVNDDVRSRRLLHYNESWLGLDDGDEQCAVALPDFFENYPYGIRIESDAIELELWPAWSGRPWRLVQGSGKTHEFALGFSPREESAWPQAFGYAVGKGPLTRVAWDDLEKAGAYPDLLDYDADRYPRIESTLYDITYNRNRGYGKMNYGDDYSALYTNQGRGHGEIVWNNLEGDYPFHMFCQFQRTGQYLYWKEFRNGILHWSDVDFRDRHEDPLQRGALVTHSAGHNSGNCSPCHNWAEGFREWYYATGDPRPLEILRQMADWLTRKAEAGFFKLTPHPYIRGCGWGLIQLAAIQEVLDRPDLKSLIDSLCRELLEYCREHGGLPMAMPTGGNHVPMDNAFHSATVVMGAERCWRLYQDPIMRDLALEVAAAFMDERTCSPEGIAVYISSPEQGFPMQQAATFALGGLAAAYRLNPDARYVQRGMRMLEYCLDRGMIVDHMRIPGEFIEIGDDVILNVSQLMPNTQLSSYQLRGLLLFMKVAHETDMLRKVDYVY